MKFSIFAIFLLICLCLSSSANAPRSASKTSNFDRLSSLADFRAENLNDAKSAPKFALLIGINRYDAAPGELKNLNGCENDADEMKKLLIEQYGFTDDGKHIVVLKSEQATKERILLEFKNHLIGNAEKFKDQKPTIVFYFSGHGSRTADLDGDEGDGQDETLVPYDRRAAGDIIDDTIDDLFQQLRPLTTNVTFILDSCHSGTANKGFLTAREAKPLTEISPVKTTGESIDRGNPILSRNFDGYATIAGCLPYQKSYEDQFDTARGKVFHGVMTYYLLQILRAAPNESFAEIGETLRHLIQSHYGQSPQVEGNIKRLIFEGANTNARSLIAVRSIDNEKKIVTIGAGSAQGVDQGGFVAFYDKKATALKGEKDRLAVGQISAARAFDADVVLPANSRPIDKQAQVVVIMPGYGTKRLKAAFENHTKTDDKNIINRVKILLGESGSDPETAGKVNPLVEIVNFAPPNAAEWNVAVVRDTFAMFKNSGGAVKNPAGIAETDEGYYLTMRDGSPIYGTFISKSGDETAENIVAALENRARFVNLAALGNDGSDLQSKVRLTLQIVEPSSRAVIKELPINTQGIQTLKIGERFRFKIENNDRGRLFFTMLSLNSDGCASVVVTPEEFGGAVSRNTTVFQKTLLRALEPVGLSRLKIFVTTKEADFSFLNQCEGTKDIKSLTNPLQQLANQALRGEKSTAVKVLEFEDWTTIDLDLMIQPAAP